MLAPRIVACLDVTGGRVVKGTKFVDLRDQGALSDIISTRAAFNAFSSAISTGQLATVAANGTATIPVTISPAEFSVTPARGLMIVTLDNRSGERQATLLPVTEEERGD